MMDTNAARLDDIHCPRCGQPMGGTSILIGGQLRCWGCMEKLLLWAEIQMDIDLLVGKEVQGP